MQVSGVVSKLKRALLPAGQQPRTVPVGLYRGIKLNLDFGYQSQHYLGLWERETYRAIRAVAGQIDWAVDVGAGRGELCLYLLIVGCCPHVYAFEPNRQEAAELRTNFTLNGSRKKGELHLAEKFVGTGPDAVRLDDLPLDRFKRGFIKIDVDGAEIDVLKSGQLLLTSARPSILLEVHSVDLEEDSIAMLRGFGYKIKIIDNAWWRVFLPEQRPLDHNRWLMAT